MLDSKDRVKIPNLPTYKDSTSPNHPSTASARAQTSSGVLSVPNLRPDRRFGPRRLAGDMPTAKAASRTLKSTSEAVRAAAVRRPRWTSAVGQ